MLVQALTHGNELCGAIALDYLFREGVRPVAGRLTFIFANIEAFAGLDAQAVQQLHGHLGVLRVHLTQLQQQAPSGDTA